MKKLAELPQSSKVWVYQSSKELSKDEVNQINSILNDFTSTWTSHGESVDSAFEIFLNRFLVIAINDAGDAACGRSIDASVRFFKDIDQEFKLNLFDRMLTAYLDEINVINVVDLAELEKRIEDNRIQENTIVFNNTVHTISEFNSNWKIPLKNSWQSRYLKIEK